MSVVIQVQVLQYLNVGVNLLIRVWAKSPAHSGGGVITLILALVPPPLLSVGGNFGW
jgi:hypothetical protein